MKPAAFLTTNVVGGLGNQLFLIANLLATAQRNGIPAFLEPQPFSSSAEAPRPTYWSSLFRTLDQHGVSLAVPSPVRSAATAPPVVAVPETRPIRKIALDPHTACVYHMIGFFQSDEFFNDYPRMKTVIPSDLWQAAREHLRQWYNTENRHTVALHVRRGDYTHFRDIFEQLEVDYYDAAVRQLLGGLLLRPRNAHAGSKLGMAPPSFGGGPPRLLIFSDDHRVAQTMAGFFRAKYRGLDASVVSPTSEERDNTSTTEDNSTDRIDATLPVTASTGGTAAASMPRDVLELLMMAQCNDVVLANSTFSWWGGYLNATPLCRVIAPSKWFVKDPYPASNHLYCPGWMLI